MTVRPPGTVLQADPAALVREDRVHREVYRNPEIFAQEMERIFKGTWVFLCHESQVAHPGDYITLRVGREPVIVVRDEESRLRVLVNRCRHRAAAVCEWEMGNAKTFRCQYHGWTYGNDGKLIAVPMSERFDEGVTEGLDLLALGQSYRGLIFGCSTPSCRRSSSSTTLRSRPRQCGDHLQSRLDMVGNLQMENGIDGYHGRFTHRSFFGVLQERTGKDVRYASSIGTATAKAFRNGHTAIDPETPSQQPLRDRIASLPDAERLLGDLRSRVADAEYERLVAVLPGTGINVGIFPNLQLIGIHIRRIEPVSVERTIVSVRPLLVADAPAEFNYRVLSRDG